MYLDKCSNYKHFIHFVQISQLCFSPYTPAESAAELEHLIEIFGTRYRILYPLAPVRPKLHFLTHLVEQIPKFGSMHGVNCLHSEGKHSWFKDMCTKNFKNLPMSLSTKHQLYMSNIMMNTFGGPAENFLYRGDEVGEGDVTLVSHFNREVYELLCQEFGV